MLLLHVQLLFLLLLGFLLVPLNVVLLNRSACTFELSACSAFVRFAFELSAGAFELVAFESFCLCL